jgi:hypothetical protein
MGCEKGKHEFTHVLDENGKSLREGNHFIFYCKKCGSKSVV